MVKKEEIIKLLNLYPSGNKGWYTGNCPICGTEKKFGVVFSEKSASFNCFAGKCEEKGHIYKILKLLDRTDLISFQYNPTVLLENTIIREQITEDFSEAEEKPLPRGFKRIYSDIYLENRKFTKKHFETYIIGESTDITLKDYIIFGIIENGKWKGYVARSRKSKSWIDSYNLRIKSEAEQKGIESPMKYLRWKNSVNTEFDKLLFGLDEIEEGETKTAILVEGVTSKGNVDNLLNLFDYSEAKCLGTFGKSISFHQMKRLQQKGIENIILLYDADAIISSKKHSIQLSRYFNVRVGYLQLGDPGDLSGEELYSVLDNLQDPVNFNINIIQKKLLI